MGGVIYNASFKKKLFGNDLRLNAGNAVIQQLEKEIDSGKIKSGEVESRLNQLIGEYKIKQDAMRAEKNEMIIENTEEIEEISGGYCGFSCRYYREEFFSSCGGIEGDFDSEGYVEYYCALGYCISHGSFCEYYE